MKPKIHPKYYKDAKVICSCGNTFTTGSTKPEIKVEVCSSCHPFYTGKKKLIDTTGAVDKFKEKLAKKAKGVVIGKREKRKLVKERKIASKIDKSRKKK